MKKTAGRLAPGVGARIHSTTQPPSRQTPHVTAKVGHRSDGGWAWLREGGGAHSAGVGLGGAWLGDETGARWGREGMRAEWR